MSKADDASGAAGTDHIRFTAPYDGIYYVDASWHQGFADIDKYAAISVYVDLDTIPSTFPGSSPSVSIFSPTNFATDVSIDSNITLTFSETIQRGSGSISLVTADNVLVEFFDAESSNNLSISDKTLTINPTNNLSNNSTQYFVALESDSVEDLAGDGNAEITSYSFTTTAQTPDTNADIIFDWGEHQYPDLFSDRP